MESHDKYAYINRSNAYEFYSFIGSEFVMEVKINSIGLRERELQEEHFVAHVKRVLAVGDSGTFGFGVNVGDRFSTILESLLNNAGYEFIVINTGVAGWGTIQEVMHALDHMEIFKPDYIILTFVGNDPGNDDKFLMGMKDAEKGLIYFPGKKFIRKHSHLYRILANYAQPVIYNWLKRRWFKRDNTADRDQATFDTESASFISERQWDRTLKIIKNFHSDYLKYNPDGLLIMQSSNPTNPDIRVKLNELSNGNNLLYVDLYTDAQKVAKRKLPYDGHWSREMHTVSAKKLFDIIQQDLLRKNWRTQQSQSHYK